jgi:enoyl-CoA hydratase
MVASWESSYETIAFERRGRALTVILDDPERLNAVSHEMHTELERVFVDAARDEGSDVVVLTGRGRAFSAGGDIARMQAIAKDPSIFVIEDRAIAKRVVFSLLDLEKPIIAKINGPAVGLGATLALFCDVSFMADTARIGDPHVSVGLVAGDGGAVIWPQLVGFHKAKEYLLTGELISGPTAAAIGLVNHCVPASELNDRVDAFCDRLLAGAARAIQWTKIAVNLELKRLAHAVMDVGMAYEALTARSADHAEAASAFVAKRKPTFVGR